LVAGSTDIIQEVRG